MSDVTFGVKMPEEFKKQIEDLMKDSGVRTGKEFMQQLVNCYTIEKTKESIPEVAQDLKELQGLTQRINNIYLSLGYRIENLIKDKDLESQSQLERKDKIITDLQFKNEGLNLEKDSLIEAFNNAVNEKNELNERVNQLTNMYNDNKALVEEYKEKNDTLTGLVNEYKGYKTEIEEYKKLLVDSQSRNIELTDSIKEKDSTIGRLNDTLEDLKAKNEAEIKSLKEKHLDEIKAVKDKAEFEKEKALLLQDKKYQEAINKINNEHNEKIRELLSADEEHNKKIKDLLDQLEEAKKQKAEPAKTKKTTTSKESKQ